MSGTRRTLPLHRPVSLAAALLLWAALGDPASAADAGPDPTPAAASERAPPMPVLTAKERLGGKARDEQRLDDCKVPAQARTKPRPGCPERDEATPKR
jgi:hypothetical protein